MFVGLSRSMIRSVGAHACGFDPLPERLEAQVTESRFTHARFQMEGTFQPDFCLQADNRERLLRELDQG